MKHVYSIHAAKTNLSRLIERAEAGDEVFEELPITVRHGQRAGELAAFHEVPFDRNLVAQALTEGLTLVSNEEVFDAYGVRRF